MKLSDEDLWRPSVSLRQLDPAPDDLADGVLARLAVEDLEREYELLTLVERVDLAAGTRSATDTTTEGDDSTVALEFAGTSYRVLVRISTVDGHRRLDGWVVPAIPMHILVGPPARPGAPAPERRRRRDGRFEFAAPMTGEVRLWLVPRSPTPPPPHCRSSPRRSCISESIAP